MSPLPKSDSNLREPMFVTLQNKELIKSFIWKLLAKYSLIWGDVTGSGNKIPNNTLSIYGLRDSHVRGDKTLTKYRKRKGISQKREGSMTRAVSAGLAQDDFYKAKVLVD